MIYNFQSYVFFSAMAIGAALALLMRVLLSKNRKEIWAVVSAGFIVYLIASIILILAGLIVTGWTGEEWEKSLAFFFLVSGAFTAAFFLVKQSTYLIATALMLILFFYFALALREYRSFGDGQSLSFTVLKVDEASLELELKTDEGVNSFYSIKRDYVIPRLEVLEFSQFLFFLDSSWYYRFAGFESEVETPLPEVYSGGLWLPRSLYKIAVPEIPPILPELMFDLRIEANRKGDFFFSGSD